MTFPKPTGVLLGLISTEGDRVQLTLYARERRRPVAVVIGSSGYVLLALVAVGLAAAPVASGRLRKHGDRSGVTLVGYQPAHRHAKRLR